MAYVTLFALVGLALGYPVGADVTVYPLPFASLALRGLPRLARKTGAAA